MSWSNVVRRTPVALLCVTGILLCAFALSMPGASAAPDDGDVVGVTGRVVVTRLLGVILAAMAMDFVFRGVTSFVKGLGLASG